MGDVQGLCDDDVTVQQFCSRYVEPMGEESDHIQLVALTDALLVRTHTWESQPIPRPCSCRSVLYLAPNACCDPDVDGP